MEHRYAHRFPTHLKALIFRGGMPIAVGHILNFSRDGIFLKTEFHQIEINQQLEIEVIARGSRSPIDYGERGLCKAFVVHKANSGLGLLMREDCAITQKHYAAIVAKQMEFRNVGERYRVTPCSNEVAVTGVAAFVSNF